MAPLPPVAYSFGLLDKWNGMFASQPLVKRLTAIATDDVWKGKPTSADDVIVNALVTAVSVTKDES